MKFTTAAIAASAAALVSAAPSGAVPAESQIKVGDTFSIMTIRSGSDIQYGQLQAIENGFTINKVQDAFCSEKVNYASFRLTDAGELYLKTDNPPQQAFVDRSGMGQGVFRYTTGVEGAGRNSERTGFTVDANNNLIFKDKSNQEIGFQACPAANGTGYNVWLDITKNPAGSSNCVGFVARAVKEDTPITCMYSQQQ